jgi:hypothetical protein
LRPFLFKGLDLNEPKRITKGDTIAWRESFGNYPASQGWALSYAIRGPVSLDVNATADHDDFVITINPAQSDTLTQGYYRYQAIVTKGSEVHTVSQDFLLVDPDLSAASVPMEARVSARVIFDAIKAMIAGTAGQAERMIEIAGRRLENWTPEELRKAYTNWELLAQKEEAQVSLDAGKKRRKIVAQFTQPS